MSPIDCQFSACDSIKWLRLQSALNSSRRYSGKDLLLPLVTHETCDRDYRFIWFSGYKKGGISEWDISLRYKDSGSGAVSAGGGGWCQLKDRIIG